MLAGRFITGPSLPEDLARADERLAELPPQALAAAAFEAAAPCGIVYQLNTANASALASSIRYLEGVAGAPAHCVGHDLDLHVPVPGTNLTRVNASVAALRPVVLQLRAALAAPGHRRVVITLALGQVGFDRLIRPFLRAMIPHFAAATPVFDHILLDLPFQTDPALYRAVMPPGAGTPDAQLRSAVSILLANDRERVYQVAYTVYDNLIYPTRFRPLNYVQLSLIAAAADAPAAGPGTVSARVGAALRTGCLRAIASVARQANVGSFVHRPRSAVGFSWVAAREGATPGVTPTRTPAPLLARQPGGGLTMAGAAQLFSHLQGVRRGTATNSTTRLPWRGPSMLGHQFLNETVLPYDGYYNRMRDFFNTTNRTNSTAVPMSPYFHNVPCLASLGAAPAMWFPISPEEPLATVTFVTVNLCDYAASVNFSITSAHLQNQFVDQNGFLRTQHEAIDYDATEPGAWVPLADLSGSFPPPRGTVLPLNNTQHTFTADIGGAAHVVRNGSAFLTTITDTIPPLTLRVSRYRSRVDLARVPVPPRQTPDQRHTMGNISALAAQQARALNASVLAALDAPLLRKNLRGWCSDPRERFVANLSAADLVARASRSLRTVEMLHTFGQDVNDLKDPTMEQYLAPGNRFFYSLWHKSPLHFGTAWEPEDSGCCNNSEVCLFGLPAYRFGMDFEQSSSRLVYTGLNFEQRPLLSEWGNLSVVFNGSFVRPMTAISPKDTGDWHYFCVGSTCTESLPPDIYHKYPHGPPVGTPSCQSWWPPIPGTFDHFVHLLNFSLHANQGQLEGILCPLSRPVGSYYEANILGTVEYPHGIKMVTASFPALYGTARGAKLRQYCILRGWVLSWGNCLYAYRTPVSWCSRGRIMDAATVFNATAGHNMSAAVRQRSLAAAESMWRVVGANISVRHDAYHPGESQYLAWWKLFNNSSPEMAIRPQTVDECSEVDQCIGVQLNGNRSCVCYSRLTN